MNKKNYQKIMEDLIREKLYGRGGSKPPFAQLLCTVQFLLYCMSCRTFPCNGILLQSQYLSAGRISYAGKGAGTFYC